MGRLRNHVRGNLIGYIALFVALGTGGAYAANEWTGANIVDESLTHRDLKDGAAVTSAEVRNDSLSGGGLTNGDIANGALNDEDVGSVTLVNVLGVFPPITANECFESPVTGIPVRGDHVLLTPSNADAHTDLHYSALYDPNEDQFIIKTCNPTSEVVDDGTTHFNALVIDAQ